MNYLLVGRVFGLLLMLVAAAQAACFVVALFEPHDTELSDHAPFALGISALITGGTAAILMLLGRHSGAVILRKEAIVIVGLGWIICTLFGTLPYLLSSPALPPAAALFESASGFTTTGATVIADLDHYPRSLLLWRSLTQWLGGMGILVLFVALLSYLGVGSRSLMQHESSIQVSEGRSARVAIIATQLWLIYVGLTIIAGAGMWVIGQLDSSTTVTVFDAFCHAFTTASTGGFSQHNTSIAYFDSLALEIWIALMMIAGSISFMLYALSLQKKWRRWLVEEEAPLYLLLLAAATLAVTIELSLHADTPFSSALRRAFFNVIAISTSTGYATDDYDAWPIFSQTVILLLMIIGGCAGSTSGGIKLSRVLLFFKIARQEIVRAFRPNQVFNLAINGHHLDANARTQTLLYLSMAAAISLISAPTLLLLDPMIDDLHIAFGAAISALCNIGPAFGPIGPTNTFADLAPHTHVLLSFLMILGRLELFAILALFVPSLWKKY
jgi:trk system potassium uptake protein